MYGYLNMPGTARPQDAFAKLHQLFSTMQTPPDTAQHPQVLELITKIMSTSTKDERQAAAAGNYGPAAKPRGAEAVREEASPYTAAPPGTSAEVDAYGGGGTGPAA